MKDIEFKSNDYYYPLAVSSCGKVKNLVTGNIRKQPLGSHGYPIISRFFEGKNQCICVHRMVAEILIPNPEEKRCVNHKDSDRTNNSLINLEWVTHAENSQHAAKNERFVFNGVCGEGSNLALYPDSKIHEVCKDIAEGMRNIDVARKHNIPAGYIKALKANKSRRDITTLYTFPEFKKQSVAESTVRWICERIAEGLTRTEIISLSTNPKVTVTLIKNIRQKGSYKIISDLYF